MPLRLALRAGSLALSAAIGCSPSGGEFHTRYVRSCKDVSRQTAPGAIEQGLAVEQFREPFRDELEDEDSEIRRCYMEALQYRSLAGTTVLRTQVSPQGIPEAVSVRSDTTEFPGLACCVAGVIRGLHFEPTGAPQSIALDYPFIFRTVRTPKNSDTEFVYSSARKDAYEVVLDASRVQRSIVEAPWDREDEPDRWVNDQNK